MNNTEHNEAILKMPRKIEDYPAYTSYEYKGYSIIINKPRKKHEAKLIHVWSKIDLSIQIIGDEDQKKLLELAVYWIDMMTRKQKK